MFYMSWIESNCPLSHLLLTRPSKSRALECFIVDTCEKSTHMAIYVSDQLYWAALPFSNIYTDPMVHASSPERRNFTTY